MRAPEVLAAYVRDALAAGARRADIAAALADAGWSGAEIDASLAAWIDVPGLPPAPRPRAAVSPRDALAFGVLFVALGIVVTQLGVLAFALIDLWLPDPLEAADWSGAGVVRWAVAALVVAWPVWAWLSLSLARAEARDPGRRRSAVGHWLTAVALFIAAAVGIGDLIAVVAALLGGELTWRFLLKAAVMAALAAAVFAAYRPALGGGEDAPRRRDAASPGPAGAAAGRRAAAPDRRARRLVALGGATAAALAALALWQVGGPAASRQQTRDARRLADIQAAASALECHVQSAAAPARPATLADISPACLSPARAAELVDPATGAPYPIAYPEPGLARLCAAFEARAVARPWTPPSFDAATGCISVALADRASPP